MTRHRSRLRLIVISSYSFFIILLTLGCDETSPGLLDMATLMTDRGLNTDQEVADDLGLIDGGESDGGESDGGLDDQRQESCEGLFTLPTCLELSMQMRALDRVWRPLNLNEDMTWEEPTRFSISTLFDTDLEESLLALIGELLPERLPSGEAEVTATSLVLTTPSSVSSVEIDFRGFRGDRIFQAGYQSWSFSGAISPPEQFQRDEEGHLFVREALTGDPLHGEHGVSFGLIAGQRGEGAERGVWLLAHLDPTYTLSAFGAEQRGDDDQSLTITARLGFEDIPLRGDGSSSSADSTRHELTLITAPTMWLALRAYQHLLSERLQRLSAEGVRSEQTSDQPQRPLRGWYSWNERFEEIDAPYIMEHLDLVDEHLRPLGFTLVELDDGWQRGWGDWVTNEQFPDGFEPLIDRAQTLDLSLGLWFAPFLVDIEVAERLDYPDEWFVYPLSERGPEGDEALIKPMVTTGEEVGNEEPLEHKIIGNPRTYYILDTTHPEAMTHVLTELAVRAAQGFTYFKLDFLYAAAIPGRRTLPLSGTESLRRGMAMIREAVGAEVIINACGAPVRSILGYADSLRIGADTTFGDLYPAFIASAARSTAARAYLYPLIWPDGDQVQTRRPYLISEAEAGAAVAALASAAYSIGDDLTTLPTERLALFTAPERLWWADMPAPAIPLDLMNTPAEQWLGNPLADHLQRPGSTLAPPPQRYLGISESGEARLLEFEWSEPFSVEGRELGD